jgi:sec-independent protein translocase protein TatB
VFDIGIGEIILIAIVGLLVFGPDRLPRAAADAAKWLKQVRSMASSARQDLADSAGLDLNDALGTVRSLQEFHPRKIASSILDSANDEPAAMPAKPTPPATEPGGRPTFDPDAT